ncbi:MAG TPA: aldehyde dehydrogenase family protein [Burkholderiales bacterium]|nr:aldehyde dehydrogenase family protein [Burkholderiales bacterium]
MNDPKISGIAALNLKDPSLFRQQCYIDGKWADADSGKSIPVNNPATGEILGTVPNMGAAEARRAIEAANAAFPAWRAKTAKERANILRKWFDLMMANQEDLAKILTAEQGKPLAEARTEISYGASFIEWFAEEGKRIYGDTIPGHQADKRIVVIKEPIGVCAAITPWNFPNAMITRKSGPALAAGCTMVLKPATATPYSALAMAELGERAGIPKGVFSVLTGSSAAIGGELTSNPLVRKITFTGSTAVGKVLLEQCSKTVKKTSMELGGNAPFIVFDDADLDAAVEKVEEHISDALSKGAKILTGGKRHALGGTFFEPTVLANVNTTMKVTREETFGPVAPLFRFKDEKEAIKLANDTEFGLASYFYGRDLNRMWRVAEALEYGIVGINTGIISTEVAPFGGVKESGMGREGSKYGIEDYLVIKYLCMGGVDR